MYVLCVLYRFWGGGGEGDDDDTVTCTPEQYLQTIHFTPYLQSFGDVAAATTTSTTHY